MNKILKLYQEDFVKDYFHHKILPRYPELCLVKSVDIHPRKNLVWETTYHVVIEFRTTFVNQDGEDVILPIFATAHSNEPRKNVYEGLKFLWKNDFSSIDLTIPRPLNYSPYFNASFYEGAEGHNLYHYIREGKREEVRKLVRLSARWFAKLHNLTVDQTCNFSPENSLIRTAIPGRGYILERVQEKHPDRFAECQEILDTLIAREEDFFGRTDRKWLVHGDAHPENIIKTGDRSIAVIDFTDLCLSDLARDLGSFQQQLEYMSGKKLNDPDFISEIGESFFLEYFKYGQIEDSEDLRHRIETYYLWTAFRTAIFFLIGYLDKPDKAEPLLNMIKERI